MTPGTFLTVLVVGLLAGWLAGFFMKDSGYGLVWDVVLASGGSTLAYWAVQALGLSPDQGTFATMVVAFVGAASLIGAQRRFWHGVPLKKSRSAAGRRRS
jgi:uncharacterized membrane protein YeaQ/YmgE (transglycosylase-associated protein family)